MINLIIPAVLLVAFVAWRWQVRADRRRGSVRDRLVRLAHDRANRAAAQDPGALDPGPVEQQAAVALTSYALDNLDLADGFARLDQAIRDHRTNTPEGDL